MRIAIIGAGAVGLNLAGRLARGGHDPVLVARRPEVAARLAEQGVAGEDPITGERWSVPVRAVSGITALDDADVAAPILLCLRLPDLPAVAAELFAHAPAGCVAWAGNGVDGEPRLAEHFERVLGVVVRQTCTRSSATAVRAGGRGRLIVGAHDGSRDRPGARALVDPLATAFSDAGFDVGCSARLSEDRWLKLCVNLMSTPNALVRPEDHATREFVELKARLLEEAASVLAAAGVSARSCDGRDRSLADEIRHQRDSLALGTSARRHPLYNPVWVALAGRGRLEGDVFHRRILELAGRYGASAPLNERVLGALLEAIGSGQGPESVSARGLLGEGLGAS